MGTSARAGLRLVHIQDFEEPNTMPPAEREAYHRRFRTLFLDEETRRRGGLGRVARVVNAQGETFALKTLILADAEEDSGELASQRDAARRAAFDEEYQSHRALSGIKGFPRLYGRGTVDGAPALVMEWIEGETLAAARRRLYAPGTSAMAPLTVARLGRDLFDLLRRMRLVGNGFVHRDISPANIMIRTDLRSVERQADEGSFDLVLIDFGSSAEESWGEAASRFTGAFEMPRRATPAYAAPEMLVDEPARDAATRRSGAIDVYEVASVLYELLCGSLPYPARPQDALSDQPGSLLRRKMTEPAAYPSSLHATCEDMRGVLMAEPQVALPLAEVGLQLGIEPESDEVRVAFGLVDDMLAKVILACLDPRQEARPASETVFDSLSGICATYVPNVCRALRGERLLPVVGVADLGTPGRGRVLRGAGTVASGALALAIAGRTAGELGGAVVMLAWGASTWRGIATAPLVFGTLALPGLLGWMACAGAIASRRGFARGSAALALSFAFMAMLAASGVVSVAGASPAQLVAALFAEAACWWCPLVLAYVVTAPGHRAIKMSARGDTVGWVMGGMLGTPGFAEQTKAAATARIDAWPAAGTADITDAQRAGATEERHAR